MQLWYLESLILVRGGGGGGVGRGSHSARIQARAVICHDG